MKYTMSNRCRYRKNFIVKKNDVIWIKTYDHQGQKKDIVVKQYKQSNWSCNKEADILTSLREEGLAVPTVYFKSNNLIIMEYIQGEVLLDTILRQENDSADTLRGYSNTIVWELTQWLSDFYRAMKKWSKKDYIKGDMNLRNFIYGDKLYGIDFENSRTGNREKDIGRLSAFILTYNPAFSQFRVHFTRELLQSLQDILPIDLDAVIQELKLELNEISNRRNILYPQDQIEPIISTLKQPKQIYKIK